MWLKCWPRRTQLKEQVTSRGSVNSPGKILGNNDLQERQRTNEESVRFSRSRREKDLLQSAQAVYCPPTFVGEMEKRKGIEIGGRQGSMASHRNPPDIDEMLSALAWLAAFTPTRATPQLFLWFIGNMSISKSEYLFIGFQGNPGRRRSCSQLLACRSWRCLAKK